MWYQTKILVDEAGRPRSKAHVDLALLDIVIGGVVEARRQDIECWRIHRRYEGHELKVEVFCVDPSVGPEVQTAISSHQFVLDLQNARIVTAVNPATGPMQEEGVGEPGWPDEFRQVWPDFAQAQSEMQLKMVQACRQASPGSPSLADIQNRPLTDQLSFYSTLQQQIDQSWRQFGSHTFIHHMHSFFAYCPFNSILQTTSAVTIHDIR